MRSPFLSIITINFNSSEGLGKTVESVLSQTYTDLEYIVIDGQSTDGSVDYLQTLDNTMVNWISESDSGVFNAMNKGIKRAKGDYLLFLNSGDILTSSSAIMDFVYHPDFKGDIIYGDYKFHNGNKIYPDTLTPHYFMKTSLPHQSTFFKKMLFDEMGGYDESYRYGADRAFYIKCYLSKRYHFQHVPYFLTLFDLTGISNNPDEQKAKMEEDLKLLKETYGEDYLKYKEALEKELENNKVSKYSVKGILKRIKKRLKL